MTIKDIIRNRISVRTYDGTHPIESKHIDVLDRTISDISTPFGSGYEIKLRKFDVKGPQSPGTYGTVSGAGHYLLMGIREDSMSTLAAGYALEQVVLKATELGLGTCWMALTFKASDFIKSADMPAEEHLKIVSPVGYPAKKRKLLESLTRISLGSSKRRPMSEMFFEGAFGNALSPGNRFYEPLEMMRLAPSAKNSQPWRALAQDDTVWFYYEKKSDLSLLDLGIGISHFDLTLKEEGYIGKWSASIDAPKKEGYIPVVKFICLTKHN